MDKSIIFVTGMGRSGTSAIARMLSLCGGTLPNRLVGPHENNPKGHWEPTEALHLNDRFLRANGSNWFDPSPLLPMSIDPNAPASAAFVTEIRKLLRSWPSGNTLIVKEPRITVLADLWFEAARREGFNIKVLIAVRDPVEIAMSLTARDGLPNAHAGLLTLKYNFFAERFSRDLPRIFVSYQHVLGDWRHEVSRIERALETDLSRADATAIDDFLTSNLHRQRRPGNEAPEINPPALAEVYRIFMAAAIDQPLDIAALDRLFADYIAYGRIWPNVTESFLMHYRSYGKLDGRRAQSYCQEVEVCRNTPGRSAVMSPVIDRPDRRLCFLLRLRNYYARAHSHGKIIRSAAKLSRDLLVAKLTDLRERASPRPRIIHVTQGADALAQSRSVAIFVHYAPTPTVSSMVLSQLELYRALGFRILFVSTAARFPALVLKQIAGRVALVVQRRNVGLDFGAWKDMLPFLDQGSDKLHELLLVNDSVCGPLRPLEPIVADMRACGVGFFGMTESLAPVPHLQSYFLLARGAAAIDDVIAFLSQYRQTSYKRAVVRRGEIGLTTWMRRRGHAVAARFGYEPLEKTALESPIARQRLRKLFPSLFAGLDQDQEAGFGLRLRHYPLNPAHSLWRELVEVFGFPFLKTELLLRNPIGISDLDNWRLLLPPALELAPRELGQTIETHLALMRRGHDPRF